MFPCNTKQHSHLDSFRSFLVKQLYQFERMTFSVHTSFFIIFSHYSPLQVCIQVFRIYNQMQQLSTVFPHSCYTCDYDHGKIRLRWD